MRPNTLVVKYMQLPMAAANLFGMIVPGSDIPQVVLLYLTLGIFLGYVFVTVQAATDENLSFIDIVDGLGDMMRAVVLPLFQVEMCKNGDRLMNGINKLSDVEETLNGLFRDPKKPTSQAPIVARMVIRAFLQSAGIACRLLSQCTAFTTSYLLSYILMNYISLFFFVGWTILIAFLQLLNDQFQFLIARLESESSAHNNIRQMHSEFKELVKIHAQLCWAADEVTIWFQRAFLAFASYYFYTSAVSLYLISRRVAVIAAGLGSWCSIIDLISLSLWLTIRSYEIWMIISQCMATEKSSQVFTDRLHDVMKRNKDVPLEGTFKLHFLFKPRIDFWAYGFFKIDNSLIYSMVGAAATYLAVVYQSVDMTNSEIKSKNATTSSSRAI